MSGKKGIKGFTIVELLIVVVVIAILAAITIVSYNGITAQARAATHAANAKSAYKSLMVFSSMQSGGDSLDIGEPLSYLTAIGEHRLASPLVNAQNLTLYTVFDTKGTNASSWRHIAGFRPTSNDNNGFSMRTHGVGNNSLSFLYATSSMVNKGIGVDNVRSTTARYVCWASANSTNMVSGCGKGPGGNHTLLPHTGWNFNAFGMYPTEDVTNIAATAFSETHDEATRSVIIDWMLSRHQ